MTFIHTYFSFLFHSSSLLGTGPALEFAAVLLSKGSGLCSERAVPGPHSCSRWPQGPLVVSVPAALRSCSVSGGLTAGSFSAPCVVLQCFVGAECDASGLTGPAWPATFIGYGLYSHLLRVGPRQTLTCNCHLP